MVGMGVPELVIILVIGLVYVVPLAAGVWALVTLQRIRTGQEALRLRLEGIERLLQKN